MSRLPGSGHLPPVDTKPAVIVANPRHTDEEKGFVNDAVAPEQRLRLLRMYRFLSWTHED
jgi:hypothetical protein